MTTQRPANGDTPNDRSRQQDSSATTGGWNRQPDEPPVPRGSPTAVSQADGHP